MKQPLPDGKRPLPTSRFFEDFKLGEQYIIPSRTQTSGLFAMFQSASGDNDPIHYDVEFCRQRGHDDLLAHGMQVMIQTAAGAGTFPSEVADSLLGMIEVRAGFYIRSIGATLSTPCWKSLSSKIKIQPVSSQCTPQSTTRMMFLSSRGPNVI